MKVDITGDKYRFCQESAKNMWCSSKPGSYGKGLINTEEDKWRVERTGFLGEMAFSIISGLPVDFSYKNGGDKYDFKLEDGSTIDVKTASRNYKVNCITAINRHGKTVFKEHTYFVGAYLINESQEDSVATVEIVGWEYGSIVKTFPIKGARAAGLHKNYELVHKELRKIEDLLDIICGVNI